MYGCVWKVIFFLNEIRFFFSTEILRVSLRKKNLRIKVFDSVLIRKNNNRIYSESMIFSDTSIT